MDKNSRLYIDLQKVSEIKILYNKSGYDHLFKEKESIPEIIKCGEVGCKCGGFKLGEVLHRMILNKETELEDTLYCFGGSPQRSCTNEIKIKIKIKYYDEELLKEV